MILGCDLGVDDVVIDAFDRLGKGVDVYGEVWNSKRISTYKGGGCAYVYMPKNVEEFCKICAALQRENKQFFVLGSGSNVIVKDGFCKCALVSTRALNRVEMRGEKVYCECGATVRSVINFGRENGLGGLEFLCGVPCTIGGAVRMNAGAFSSQTADYIDKLHILNIDCVNNCCNDSASDTRVCGVNDVGIDGVNGACCAYDMVQEISRDDVDFAYRKGCDKIVLGVTLTLDKMEKKKSLERAKYFLEKRVKNQPRLPSCGSVFKNGKVASAKLIERCGLKGLQVGGAQISNVHANFIVNVGGGSASDYLALVDIAQDAVYKKFGIQLEREVIVLE